jgi:hypothetical protein
MKEAVYQVKSGDVVYATGSIFHADGKALDSKAINAAVAVAASLGYTSDSVIIWRPSKNGGGTGHKKAVFKPKAKDGEPKYKAVAA